MNRLFFVEGIIEASLYDYNINKNERIFSVQQLTKSFIPLYGNYSKYCVAKLILQSILRYPNFKLFKSVQSEILFKMLQ